MNEITSDKNGFIYIFIEERHPLNDTVRFYERR